MASNYYFEVLWSILFERLWLTRKQACKRRPDAGIGRSSEGDNERMEWRGRTRE